MTQTREEAKVKPFEITPDYLIGIFRDREFIANLRRVRDFKGPQEVGFNVAQLVNESFYQVLEFAIGQERSMSGSRPLDDPDSDIIMTVDGKNRYDTYELISLHLHPDVPYKNLPSYPSSKNMGRGDLMSFSFERDKSRESFGIAVRNIGIIYPSSRGKAMRLLLIQERGHPVSYETLLDVGNDLDRKIEPYGSLEQTISLLEGTGLYNSGIVTLNEDGEYDETSLKTISRFAFEPKVVDRKQYREFLQGRWI